MSRISAWALSWAVNNYVGVATGVARVAISVSIAATDGVVLVSAKTLAGLKREI